MLTPAMLVLMIASIFSTLGALAMLRGSMRTRTSDGIAVGMLIMNIANAPLWVAYGAANGNWLQVATSVLWTGVNALWWGFWATDRGRAFWPIPMALAAWTVLATAAAFTVVPFEAFGWIAGIVGTASMIPQMIALLKADHLGEGINMVGWLMGAVSLTCWTLYGLFSGELPVLVPNIVAWVINAIIIMRATVLLRQRSTVGEAVAADQPSDIDVDVDYLMAELDEIEHLVSEDLMVELEATMELPVWRDDDTGSLPRIR